MVAGAEKTARIVGGVEPLAVGAFVDGGARCGDGWVFALWVLSTTETTRNGAGTPASRMELPAT